MSDYVNFLFESIMEAPLADFGAYGDLSREGSLRPDDIKAVQSPKWLKKLDSHFSRTPWNFNIYVFNATEANQPPEEKLRMDDGSSSFKIPHPLYPDEPKYTSRVNPRNISVHNLDRYAGFYDEPGQFKSIFGFEPKTEGNITILLVQNEGDGRIPLTPWMVAHRICHALQYGGANHFERHRRTLSSHAVSNQIYQLTNEIRNALMKADSILSSAPAFKKMEHGSGHAISMGIAQAASLIGKTKAMQAVVDRTGEATIEIMAQFIVQGRVRFNTPDMGGPFNWLDFTNRAKVEMDENVFKGIMNSHAVKINNEMRKLLDLFVGRILVF
jgi:hypothetical protein